LGDLAVSRPKRTPRARTLERIKRAADDKLARAKRKLLELEPGGSEAHPLEVATAAVVEPKAKGVLCPRCDEAFQVENHVAHGEERGRLREVLLECRLCGEHRSMWFRIVAPS
jgi:hypothetical protein